MDDGAGRPAEWPPMTSSELWSRAEADRYDAEETEMASAAVLGPTVDFLAELARTEPGDLGVCAFSVFGPKNPVEKITKKLALLP